MNDITRTINNKVHLIKINTKKGFQLGMIDFSSTFAGNKLKIKEHINLYLDNSVEVTWTNGGEKVKETSDTVFIDTENSNRLLISGGDNSLFYYLKTEKYKIENEYQKKNQTVVTVNNKQSSGNASISDGRTSLKATLDYKLTF